MAFTGLTGSRALPTWEAFPFIAEINEAIDFIHGDVGLTGTFGLTGAGITGLAGLTANFGYSGVTTRALCSIGLIGPRLRKSHTTTWAFPGRSLYLSAPTC